MNVQSAEDFDPVVEAECKPCGRVTEYVHYNTTATITGRFSTSNPNLQNLPRDGTSKVLGLVGLPFSGYWTQEGDVL